MKKLGGRAPPPKLNAHKMDTIVIALFFSHETRAEKIRPTEPPNDARLFTIEELQTAAKKLKPNKAPGPDGIPAEALKIIAESRPNLLLGMFNTCLKSGVFPEVWKK